MIQQFECGDCHAPVFAKMHDVFACDNQRVFHNNAKKLSGRSRDYENPCC